MENWTLDKWLSELDDNAKQDLYFEISGHSAGALRDRINHLKDIKDKEIERLRELFELERKDNIDVRHHLAKANDQIEQLHNFQGRLIGTFRVNMTHEGFDEVIAALKEGE
jgi:hypothetical protein